MKATQRIKILDYLQKHPEGLNSYKATYELNIKQAPTRIKELKEKGHTIHSVPQKDRSVNWVLDTASRPSVPVMGTRLEEQYVFLPDGRAVLREQLEPQQGGLI